MIPSYWVRRVQPISRLYESDEAGNVAGTEDYSEIDGRPEILCFSEILFGAEAEEVLWRFLLLRAQRAGGGCVLLL